MDGFYNRVYTLQKDYNSAAASSPIPTAGYVYAVDILRLQRLSLSNQNSCCLPASLKPHNFAPCGHVMRPSPIMLENRR